MPGSCTKLISLSALLVAALLLLACTPSERELQLQATVEALAATNATLEAVNTPMPLASVAPAVEPSAAETAAPAHKEIAGSADAATGGPIPREIGRVSLVGAESPLADFRLDAAENVAYLTDAGYALHVVDLATMEEVASFATSGDRLLLDAPNSRLYIMPDAPYARTGISPTVTVFDTATRQIVAELPGSRASVDDAGGRLYIGDDVAIYGRSEVGVRLYDAETLQLLRTGPMAGNPVYNGAADELLVQANSVWTVDPATLEARNDLYPQITGLELPGCNGCPTVVDAFVFPDEQLVAIQTAILSPQGAGRIAPADLYDAQTMQRQPDSNRIGATCSSLPQVLSPINGHILAAERYSRYVSYNNLELRDMRETPLVWRDGLWVGFTNPATNAGYLQSSSQTGYVLDLATLAPVGMTDSLCYLARDGESGLLYATDAHRHDLVVLEPTGGASSPPAARADTVDGKQVTSILLSPDYARDATMYLVAWTLDSDGGQAVLRSTDGGQTFTRLGGLPTGEELALTLALSPNFADDRTLFAGGARRESMGEGVWKSVDGGDTWTPVWNGLGDLRVYGIELSSRYAEDQTVLAWARYARIRPFESGDSIQKSTDGGATWTRVITATTREMLPGVAVYLPVADGEEMPVRKSGWADPIQFRVVNNSWLTATNNLGSDELLRAILTSPSGGAVTDIFVVTEAAVYRTQDAGVTWALLAPETAGDDALMQAAVTPRMSDGAYRLILATAKSTLLQIDPNTVSWLPVEAATPTNALDPAPEASSREEAPAAATAGAAPDEDPPADLFRPGGIFGPRWEGDSALRSAMGFARSEQPASVSAAYQYFQNGIMIWRGDTQTVYSIYDDGTWQSWPDTFTEGEAESDAAIVAPSGYFQPERGFGKVWRIQPTVRERLGWANGKEAGASALVQEFERGTFVHIEGIEAALYDTPEGKAWTR